jgi:hypothetical protein
MAQTQAQWYAKISKWVPAGFFLDQGGTNDESEALTEAVLQAFAGIFAQCDQDLTDQQAATFILQSSAPIIDLLGDERNVPRPEGYTDAEYAPVIQNSLFLSVGSAQLAANINAVLNNGPVFMINNQEYGYFDDADVSETPGFPYYDDYYTIWLDLRKWYNWWTCIIPVQTGGNLASIMTAIVTAIQNNMALGTTYDIRMHVQTNITDESGNQMTDESGNTLIGEQT